MLKIFETQTIKNIGHTWKKYNWKAGKTVHAILVTNMIASLIFKPEDKGYVLLEPDVFRH